MRRADVRTPADALLYLTDCTLATVEGLAMRKSAPKGELKRQIEMAQTAVNWIREMGIPTKSVLRIEQIETTVEAWASKIRQRSHHP